MSNQTKREKILEARVKALEDKLRRAKTDRKYWRKKAYELQKQLSDAQLKIEVEDAESKA